MSSTPRGCPDDETLKWYLRDRYFDVDEAERKLSSMLKWRSSLGESLLSSDVAAELATGKAYVAEHPDVYGRPAIVIRVARHVTGEFRLADSKRLCAHVLDTALSRLPPGGEQIIGIFDLRGFQLRNADFGFAAFMVEAFFEFYPRRVGEVLLVDAPWIFRPPWEVIRPLLRKYAALVRFATCEDVRGLFTPSTRPPDFK